MYKRLSFYKESDGRWYVDLPEWEGSKAELEMVCGANTMLDIICEGEGKVTLIIAIQHFKDSDVLTLIQEDADNGGGWYFMKKYRDIDLDIQLWLCEVTRYVFGEIPKEIYIAKIDGRN